MQELLYYLDVDDSISYCWHPKLRVLAAGLVLQWWRRFWSRRERTPAPTDAATRAVLDVVAEAQDHPTARQVLDRVRERVHGVGAATVYRTLALLVASGQVPSCESVRGRPSL